MALLPSRGERKLGIPLWRRISPPRFLAASFLAMILFGMFGLRLVPWFYTNGQPLGWIDALFTATSAVCVTGLIVADTATRFTGPGQAFILLLIQLGGLGIITITTLIILTLGGRPSLRTESVVPSTAARLPEVNMLRLVRDVVGFTVAFEAIGAAVLFFAFLPRLGAASAAWQAVFHAVSAFCNAGFSTFSDSLEGWAGSGWVLWPIMVLIVLGGIGFLTLEEVATRIRMRSRDRSFPLSLHSRIVLYATGSLLVGGAVLYAFFEWHGVLADMPALSRIQNALFMSVTARTAGFETVPYSHATDPTNFLTILLMSIGGSPGSAAGGLKTTTFFVIGLLAWCRIRGRTSVSAWSRTVPEETVQRAVGLFVMAFGFVTLAILLYTAIEVRVGETDPFLWMMFEAASAFNTVGLSLGATGNLEPASRLLTIVLMFAGRVGPLSFAAALAMKAKAATRQIHFAREDVLIG
jgi:trk system potassium uptake protein TrkH